MSKFEAVPPHAQPIGADHPEGPPGRGRLLFAFLSLYVIWGSTYLAIRFAIETLPPFLMAGVRFLVAGTILYAYARLVRRAARPTGGNWKAAAIVGALLLLGGNGSVVWAEETVPSGIVALLVALVPVWMVLLDWLQGTGKRPTLQTVVGLALGFAGLILLVGFDPGAADGIDPLRAGAVLLGSLAWAAGSIYSRDSALPRAPYLSTAMQMLAGGALLIGAGLLHGEIGRVDPSSFSTESIVALLYLIVFGSIVAYTSYIWLLQVSSAALVSTYAYVNPVVAVFLGWLLADEPITPRTLLAAAVIVAGVAVITATKRERPSSES